MQRPNQDAGISHAPESGPCAQKPACRGSRNFRGLPHLRQTSHPSQCQPVCTFLLPSQLVSCPVPVESWFIARPGTVSLPHQGPFRQAALNFLFFESNNRNHRILLLLLPSFQPSSPPTHPSTHPPLLHSHRLSCHLGCSFRKASYVLSQIPPPSRP